MKRVLVTGAGGFIGRHTLQPLVDRGYEVHAVTSKTDFAEENLTSLANCTWHVVDLFNPIQVKTVIERSQPTHLLHFAWCATPGQYWTSEANFRWVQASLELLYHFHKIGGQRIVMAGTCAEYDWNYGYCSETITPLKPNTPYGICKNALQTLLAAYCNQTGLSSGWGRIFFTYGPYEHPKRVVASVIQSLLKRNPIPCSHGNQIRDFLHVYDIANAFVCFLLSEQTGTVNIASGQPVTVKEIIVSLTQKLGNAELIQWGLLLPPDNESPLIVADTRRLTQEIGWLPKFSLDAGLDQTINWWKNNYQVEDQ